MNEKPPKSSSFDIDVDLIIEKLLSVRGSKPGKLVSLTENEIRGLCLKSREIFISQPILLEIDAPIKICGYFFFFFLNNKKRRCTRTILRPLEII